MAGATYKLIEKIGPWSVLKHSATGRFYVGWYDSEAQGGRRRALHTDSLSEACARVTSLLERGVQGDPKEGLAEKPLKTVAEVLEWHRPYVVRLASREAELIHIRLMLAAPIASRSVAALVPSDFEKLRDLWKGAAVTTIGRRLTTLRSALRRAAADNRLTVAVAPKVPEFRTKNHLRAAPTKGQPCDVAGLASLYDAVEDHHLMLFLALGFSTGARTGSLIGLEGKQFDLETGLVNLNPAGRLQTAKYRPILPIHHLLRPWLSELPSGRLIRWRDQPVVSVKSGLRNAVRRAGLPARVNGYSLRHSVGRFLRRYGVDSEQIAVWLGHAKPPENFETTLIYSPYDPDYLRDAKAAVEALFAEIAGRAKRPLLTPPEEVTAALARIRAQDR